jgi:hypothetical protein
MNGNIRTWALPQIAVGPNGWVHASYVRRDGGDRGNVYYQRSTNNGVSWSSPRRINDDPGTQDQWHAALALNDRGMVVITWYDRGEDAGNLLFKRYAAFSYDNGSNWEANIAVGDVSSPMATAGLTNCYMGDYDAAAMDITTAYIQWGDNRNNQNGNQPDIFLDRLTLPGNRCASIAPDAYGYRCDDSQAGNTYLLGNINTGITGDDQVATGIPIGFNFTFYGNTYSTVNVSSNGNLQFTTANTAYSNTALPNATMGPMLAPFWDDLYPGGCTLGGCGIYYRIQGSAPNRIFVV